MIYCSQCGKENADQAKFCSSCGATLNGNVSRQSRPQVQPKAKTMTFSFKYIISTERLNLEVEFLIQNLKNKSLQKFYL